MKGRRGGAIEGERMEEELGRGCLAGVGGVVCGVEVVCFKGRSAEGGRERGREGDNEYDNGSKEKRE